jgi:hypothetical protein
MIGGSHAAWLPAAREGSNRGDISMSKGRVYRMAGTVASFLAVVALSGAGRRF